MASRFLTEIFRRFRRSFYPDLFLTGRIRQGTLYLSASSPGRETELWPEESVSLDAISAADLSNLPASNDERSRLPFLLFWPYEQTVSLSLRLPPTITAAEKEGAIGAMIELELPWPVEESLLAWDSDPSDPTSVHAWAIKRSEAERLLARLREIGLSPRWILPESLSVLHRFHPRSRTTSDRLLSAPPVTGIIDGDGTRMVCLLGRGAHVTGEGSFMLSSPSDSKRDKRVLDLMLSFVAEGHTLPPSFLRGSGIPLSPLLESISTKAPPPSIPPSMAGWTLISGRSRDESTALSFLKGGLSWQGDKKERQAGFRVLAGLSILLVASLILDASVHLSRINHRLQKAHSALDLAASRALPGHRIVEPVGQLAQELANLDRQKALLSQGPDVIRIMRDLTISPPPGISYEMISLNVTRRFFTVSGKTDSFRSVDALKKAFAATGHMRDIAIQSAGLDIDRKTVTFRLRGRHD